MESGGEQIRVGEIVMEGAKSGGQCLWECNGKWEQTVVECLSRG